MPLDLGRGSRVAVVETHGVIGNQIRVPPDTGILNNISKSNRYRALLLDIDSPVRRCTERRRRGWQHQTTAKMLAAQTRYRSEINGTFIGGANRTK